MIQKKKEKNHPTLAANCVLAQVKFLELAVLRDRLEEALRPRRVDVIGRQPQRL